mgnify:CR=1 FL=1
MICRGLSGNRLRRRIPGNRLPAVEDVSGWRGLGLRGRCSAYMYRRSSPGMNVGTDQPGT